MGGLAAFGPRDVWVATGTDSTDGREVLRRWDGRSWREVDLPGGGRQLRYVTGIGGTSSRDVWIIVNDDPDLLLHWDGRCWTSFVPPYIGGEEIAALSRDDAWIVSARYASHWDGEAWRETRLPEVAEDVAAVAANDVWASSSTSRPADDGYKGFMHWDGQRWERVSTPPVTPPPGGTSGDAQIYDIAADRAGGIWAAGILYWVKPGDVVDEVHPPRSVALLLHWDGRRWSQTLGVKDAMYYKVAPDGAGGAWVTDTNTDLRYIHHARDGTVTVIDPPRPTGGSFDPNGRIGHLLNVPGTTTMLAAGRPDPHSPDKRPVIQARGPLP